VAEPSLWQDGMPTGRVARQFGQAPSASANLADVLERVLEKGVVIAGDIKVNLLDVELLTIKLRLLVASVDKAREIGIDWWERDPSLSSRASGDLADENRRLRDRVAELEGSGTAHGESPDASATMAVDTSGGPRRAPAEPERRQGTGR
jgi:Gas vesicle protein